MVIPASIMERQKNTTIVSAGGRRPAAGYGVAVAVAVAISLLYLSVPRAASGFLSLPEYHLLDRVRTKKRIDLPALQTLLTSRQEAAGWSDSPRLHSELAAAHLLAADAGGQTLDARDQHLRNALQDLKTSLRLAPVSPHDWTRLAYAEMLLHGPSESSARILVMSLLAARYEPELIFSRLKLCLISWPFFSSSDMAAVRAQVGLAWRLSPKRVVGFARHEAWADILRSVLATNPDDLVEFERLIAASR